MSSLARTLIHSLTAPCVQLDRRHYEIRGGPQDGNLACCDGRTAPGPGAFLVLYGRVYRAFGPATALWLTDEGEVEPEGEEGAE